MLRVTSHNLSLRNHWVISHFKTVTRVTPQCQLCAGRGGVSFLSCVTAQPPQPALFFRLPAIQTVEDLAVMMMFWLDAASMELLTGSTGRHAFVSRS